MLWYHPWEYKFTCQIGNLKDSRIYNETKAEFNNNSYQNTSKYDIESVL